MNRILSIDYGSKRIGLAISDVLKIIAKPLKTIHNISDQDVIKEILDISKTLSVTSTNPGELKLKKNA